MKQVIEIVILLLLVGVFIQDMKYRAVTWYLFPLLALGFLALRFLAAGPFSMNWEPLLINCCIILMELLGVTLYVFIRYKRLVNITENYLGIGDILFLGVTACYFSVLNFAFFLNISLVLVILLWLPIQAVVKNKTWPLAGLQAAILMLFLTGDWWYFHLDSMDDRWLLQILMP